MKSNYQTTRLIESIWAVSPINRTKVEEGTRRDQSIWVIWGNQVSLSRLWTPAGRRAMPVRILKGKTQNDRGKDGSQTLRGRGNYLRNDTIKNIFVWRSSDNWRNVYTQGKANGYITNKEPKKWVTYQRQLSSTLVSEILKGKWSFKSFVPSRDNCFAQWVANFVARILAV